MNWIWLNEHWFPCNCFAFWHSDDDEDEDDDDDDDDIDVSDWKKDRLVFLYVNMCARIYLYMAVYIAATNGAPRTRYISNSNCRLKLTETSGKSQINKTKSSKCNSKKLNEEPADQATTTTKKRKQKTIQTKRRKEQWKRHDIHANNENEHPRSSS